MLSRTWLICWSNLILGAQTVDSHQQILSDQAQTQGSFLSTCHIISAQFPHLVSFLGGSLYEQEQSQYWSSTQSTLRPACRLTPTTTSETSRLVRYLSDNDVDISIVSGGHSTALGASNVDGGITLDLSALIPISLSLDKSSVTFGPGTRWGNIYKELDPHSITVAGGRAGSVGAGGFLLGGGISILAPEQGWSCDTLTSIEVVLGNGTVVTSNATHHADLFSSMKGMGSNFGVATSFTMSTFPVSQLQMSVMQYQGEQFVELAHRISEFARDCHEDTGSLMDLSIIADPSGESVFGYLMALSFGDMKQSKTLQPFLDMPHAHGYINNVRPQDIASIVDVSNPPGFRHNRNTVTIRNDIPTLLEILSAMETEFLRNDLPGDGSYQPAALIQPIFRAQLSGANDHDSIVDTNLPPKNSLGLDQDSEALLLISIEGTWQLPNHDTVANEHLRSLNLLVSSIARRHGTLHPFVYPNYAGEEQDIFEVLGSGRVEWLRGVQKKYDAGGWVREHVGGVWKL